MTKQEEIREGIENLLATFTGEGDFTTELLDYLHSKGVVIKTGDNRRGTLEVEPLIEDERYKFLREAGYVVVKPLIKEE